MRFVFGKVAVAMLSATALAASSGAALAGGFGLREQSATAQGMSFAGAASGSGGLSSMFWNPATVTMAPGFQGEWHAAIIVPQSEINPLPPTPTLAFGGSGDIGVDAVLPTSYKSYQVNDRLWLGLSTTAPYGLVTDPNQNWAGQVYSRSSMIFSANANAIVGYRVTDWLSVGGGPTLQYFKTRLKRTATPLPTASSAILEGEDFGVGFTLGATLTPFAGTTIGVGFRSAVDHELDGDLTTPAGLVIPVKAKLTTPEQVTVGISHAFNDRFSVHAGFEWVNWSRLTNSAVVGPTGPIASANLKLNYDDGFYYSLGAEYRFDPSWTFRAGVGYEQSPIDTDVRSTRLPDNDRFWASLGATYRWSERLSLDVAYTHIVVADTKIAIVPGQQDYVGLPFVADVDSNVNILSFALRYRFDTPAPAAAPLIRKY